MAYKHTHERTAERRNALQVLYQGELLGVAPSQLIADERLADETQYMGDYARQILLGIEEQLGTVDDRIEEASANWTLERMPLVDLSILRLATYEMEFVDAVPLSVSINEAVNLAKEFGGDDSPRFVNGILGRVAKVLDPSITGSDQADADAAESSSASDPSAAGDSSDANDVGADDVADTESNEG